MEKPGFLIDRRQAPRLRVACDAELLATVSLLDTSQAEQHSSPLVFMGATQNISMAGVALTLPSTRIDEKYCQEPRSLKMSLHLKPSAPVQLEISPLRCHPLDPDDPDAGYLIAARITHMSKEAEMDIRSFLKSGQQ
jgi:hypothetical protein